MAIPKALKIEGNNIRYQEGVIEADYEYNNVRCQITSDGTLKAVPVSTMVTFRTQRKVPKLGVMLVGWGGNNGSTVTAAILANKKQMTWKTKDGEFKANYFGSLTQASTVFIGVDEKGRDIYYPMKDLLPMVDPNDIFLDGWDISDANLADAMKRAKVIDYNLQVQLQPYMKSMKPRKAIFDIDFVAANQNERANNILEGMTQKEKVEQIRSDIRDSKKNNNLETIIVLWTANTERMIDVTSDIHDTKDNLLKAIENNEKNISPSILYAVASILEGSSYINGSPQNTFVPGLIELAEEKGIFIGGDDFKSGQTKFKSVIVDFLVNAGIKPCSIVSYNHLGNNDGYNLSAPKQFRSKELSKSNVVDDMVQSNKILYGQGLSHPDHCVVIKYVPFVGDSKRAMDEYTSELMLGGKNTIVVHNTCEDSLLASPIILDLVILTELFQRVTFKVHRGPGNFMSFNSVLSVLSYLFKAPLVERNAKVVNALFKQRACIENLMRALLSLPPVDNLYLQNKCSESSSWLEVKKDSLVQERKELNRLPNGVICG